MLRGSPVPILAYLFLLCVEGLSKLLQKSIKQGILKGVAACARGPEISHLYFANDSLIFCRATTNECSNLISMSVFKLPNVICEEMTSLVCKFW